MITPMGKKLSIKEKKNLFFNACESAKRFKDNEDMYFEEIWNYLDRAYDDEPNGMNGWEICQFEHNWSKWLKEYQGGAL